MSQEMILDGLPGFWKAITGTPKNRPGAELCAHRLRKLCREGYRFKRIAADTDTETAHIGYTLLRKSGVPNNWGDSKYGRVYMMTFARSPATATRPSAKGYLASTDLDWILKEFEILRMEGFEARLKSWG